MQASMWAAITASHCLGQPSRRPQTAAVALAGRRRRPGRMASSSLSARQRPPSRQANPMHRPRHRCATAHSRRCRADRRSGRGTITVWGSRRTTAYGPVTVDIPLTSTRGTASGSATLTVHGRVPASQTALVAGTYVSKFSGAAQSELDYQQYLVLAPSCSTLATPSATMPFTVERDGHQRLHDRRHQHQFRHGGGAEQYARRDRYTDR